MTAPTITEAEAIGRGWYACRRVRWAVWPDRNREAIREAVAGLTEALETYRDLLTDATHPATAYPELEHDENAYDKALAMSAQDAGDWAAELDRLVPEEAESEVAA